MIIEYTKTRESAHSPQRANPSDAGLDVFYSPIDQYEIIPVHPNETALIPTGLRFGVPHGYMLEVKNRSFAHLVSRTCLHNVKKSFSIIFEKFMRDDGQSCTMIKKSFSII